MASRPPTIRPRSRPFRRLSRELLRRARVSSWTGARRPKGSLTFWTRARRLLWNPWPWAVLTIWLIASHYWIFAAAAGVLFVGCYLARPGALPPRYGLDHEFSIDSPSFHSTIAGASGAPFVPGNRLEILNNGDAFYPRMLAAIRSAKVSITIEAYIYWAGEIGLEFAVALAERARAGCQVKILLDAIGSADIGTEILDVLTQGGCDIAWYHPIRWYNLGRFNNRTHRKSLIVDGAIVFTGGAGIADQWRGDARNPHEWRDIQICLAGPAVIPLQTGFAQNWQETTGELITGDRFYPRVEPAGTLAVQTLLSSPETGASNVHTMYYLSIVCARQSILIANPYFVPDPVALDTLIDARRRGVHIVIMVSGMRNDNWVARYNSTRLFGRLLEAGIEIQEFNRTMLHHKTMVVDGRWVTIGTTNFDNRSFALNEESNVCMLDAELASQMHQVFQDDLRGCTRLTIGAWRRRGAWTRCQEFLASFLQEQA